MVQKIQWPEIWLGQGRVHATEKFKNLGNWWISEDFTIQMPFCRSERFLNDLNEKKWCRTMGSNPRLIEKCRFYGRTTVMEETLFARFWLFWTIRWFWFVVELRWCETSLQARRAETMVDGLPRVCRLANCAASKSNGISSSNCSNDIGVEVALTMIANHITNGRASCD